MKWHQKVSLVAGIILGALVLFGMVVAIVNLCSASAEATPPAGEPGAALLYLETE